MKGWEGEIEEKGVKIKTLRGRTRGKGIEGGKEG